MSKQGSFTVGKDVIVLDIVGYEVGVKVETVSAEIVKTDSMGFYATYRYFIKRANVDVDYERTNYYFYTDLGTKFFENIEDARKAANDIPEYGDTMYMVSEKGVVTKSTITLLRREKLEAEHGNYIELYIVLKNGKEYRIDQLGVDLFDCKRAAYEEAENRSN